MGLSYFGHFQPQSNTHELQPKGNLSYSGHLQPQSNSTNELHSKGNLYSTGPPKFKLQQIHGGAHMK